jgi:hypothetical protein
MRGLHLAELHWQYGDGLRGGRAVLTMVAVKEFHPHRALRSGHLMTIVSAFLRRKFPRLPTGEVRLFEIEPASSGGGPGTRVRGDCHWQ